MKMKFDFISYLYPNISKYQPIIETHNISLPKPENAFGPESNLVLPISICF